MFCCSGLLGCLKLLITVVNGMLVVFQFLPCCRHYSLIKIVPQIDCPYRHVVWLGFFLVVGASMAWIIITLCASFPPKLHFIQEKADFEGIFWVGKEVMKSQSVVWGDREGSYNFVLVVGWRGSFIASPPQVATDIQLPFSIINLLITEVARTPEFKARFYLTCYALEKILTVLKISQVLVLVIWLKTLTFNIWITC